MARSSGHVDSLPSVTFAAAGRKFRIQDKTLWFPGGSSSIDYFIGSKTSGRSYARQIDGYLFEIPVTWYSAKQAWDASPGYEHDRDINLTRPLETSCLLCHSSQVRPVLRTQNRYGDPPFLEGGVSCERCHGAGSEHARDPAHVRMVNPAKLESERRDSVCGQCHLTGEARIEKPGKRFADFRAGDRLSDFATYYVKSSGRGDFKVTSHLEKLQSSACKIASVDKLWCGSCHETHTNEDKTQATCISCHTDAHRQTERCATCHMPKASAADAIHGVFTDHSIPKTAKASTAPANTDLRPFFGRADDRSLGLALAELGDNRAREYLLRAEAQDWPVRLRLAASEPEPARAAKLYASVLRDNPAEPAALVNLGSLLAKNGQFEEAAKLWERALIVNPAIEQAVLNLLQIRSGPEANTILERYRRINPSSRLKPN